MTLAILLSGALGAVVASIVAVVASIWREQVHFRAQVALDVAAWLEDVRATRERYFTARTLLEASLAKSRNPGLALRWEERFHNIGDQLTIIAQSKNALVQVGLAYGEAETLDAVTRLQESVERLVIEEMKALEAGGLTALHSDRITAMRSQITDEQETLLKTLVRGGSLPQLVRDSWNGPAPITSGHAV